MIVLTAGAFGTRVGERIAALRDARVHPLPHERAALEPLVADADFVAVAAWRPYVPTFLLIDELCFAAGVRWSLAEIHAERVGCGPLVWPGKGPCYQCYRRRWLSHHKAPDRELVLQRAYDTRPALGPAGFTAPMVEIAAQALVADSEADVSRAGHFRHVDLLTAAVLESRVIGIHECPRCRPMAEAPPGARFVRELVPEFERSIA